MVWNPPALEIVVKLVLAVVLAGVCGLERERKGRGAGLRTHVLVCLGSTLAMIVNGVFAEEIQGMEQFSAPVDQGRAIQGVLTGIGFLGAGTIINVGFANRGLTTAAMIWFTAALGIAIGAGEYSVAVVGTALAIFTTVILERIESIIHYPDRFFLKAKLVGGMELIEPWRKSVEEHRYRAKVVYLAVDTEQRCLDIHLEVSTWKRRDQEALVHALRERFDGLKFVELVE